MSTRQLERYGDYLLDIQPAEPFSEKEIEVLRERKKFYIYKIQCEWEWAACQKLMEQIHRTLNETKSLISESVALSGVVNHVPLSALSLSA